MLNSKRTFCTAVFTKLFSCQMDEILTLIIRRPGAKASGDLLKKMHDV